MEAKPMSVSSVSKRHRVVVVGGGSGGIELAIGLARRADVTTDEVVLIDKESSHLWKPRLHEVAAGLVNPGEDQAGYLALAQEHGFRFHCGALAGLDSSARTIRLAAVENTAGGEVVLNPRELEYDDLVLAFGSQVNDFGIEGVVEHCHLLDSSAQASAFNRSFLNAAIQVAEGQREHLAVGIVGAGATGVELAAELRHAASAMKRYGGLGAANRLDITVVDMANRVLAGADLRTSAYAASRLNALGVKIELNQAVSRVTADGLYLKEGKMIPCDLKVWASGITGQPIVHFLSGLRISKQSRIITDPRLACSGVEHIYAFGDCAAVPGAHGASALPATAQVAHQQASYLADALPRRRRGRQVQPFIYRPRGSLVSLGPSEAAGEFPALRHGRPAVLARGFLPKLLYASLLHLHRAAMHGWMGAAALAVSDRLRRIAVPPVKLH
jgi:NADH:quinone reductase (non-electrogenic)